MSNDTDTTDKDLKEKINYYINEINRHYGYKLMKPMPVHDDEIDMIQKGYSSRSKDIVNPIHVPDAPETKEEIDKAWEVLKQMCKGTMK